MDSRDKVFPLQEIRKIYRKCSNANHVDLYDQMNKIFFDKIEAFFKQNLVQK